MGGAQRGWVREGAIQGVGAEGAILGGMGERCNLPHGGLELRPRSCTSCATFMFISHTKFDHFP